MANARWQLAAALAAVAGQLEPAEAARVCAEAARVCIQALDQDLTETLGGWCRTRVDTHSAAGQ